MRKFVLIGGMPRSGTTLIETIIGSHSKISIPPGDFPFVEKYVVGRSVKIIFDELGKSPVWKFWRIVDFSDLYDKEHRDAFIETLVRYAKGTDKEIPGAKSPYNEFYFDVLQNWLKEFELKFIHIVRNPFDMMASLRHSPFHRYKLKKKFEDDVLVHSRNWCRSVSMGSSRALLNQGEYYLLKYEDLVTNPRDTTQSLCAFLGVDFQEERMLNRVDYQYHNSNTSFPKAPEKRKSKDYVYELSTRKHYLTDSEIQVISSICGELGQVLEYEDQDLRSFPYERPRLSVKRKLRRVATKLYHMGTGFVGK